MADKIGLDDFLKEQSATPTALRATVEPTAQADEVRVTPLLPGGTCPCGAGLNIPKASIAAVTPTGEHRDCCGKRLRVVDVEFAAEASVLRSVFAQLIARAARAQEALAHEDGAELRRAAASAPGGGAQAQRFMRCDFDCLDPCYNNCQSHEPGRAKLMCIRSCWLGCCH